MFEENVALFPENAVSSVELIDGIYEPKTEDGQVFRSETQPLLASGFVGSQTLVSRLFEEREDGFPSLTKETSRPRSRGCTFVAPLSAMTTMTFASYSSSGSALQSWRRVSHPLWTFPLTNLCKHTGTGACIWTTCHAADRSVSHAERESQYGPERYCFQTELNRLGCRK